MIIRKTLDSNSRLTEEQIRMLNQAKNRPIVYDEDSPYFTSEESDHMQMLAETRREERPEDAVSL